MSKAHDVADTRLFNLENLDVDLFVVLPNETVAAIRNVIGKSAKESLYAEDAFAGMKAISKEIYDELRLAPDFSGYKVAGPVPRLFTVWSEKDIASELSEGDYQIYLIGINGKCFLLTGYL